MVHPSSLHCFTKSSTARDDITSKPDVGSSKIKTGGS